MAANDYYDFNPSPATWALMLTCMVLFVLAISILLIVMVGRGQASGRATPPAAGTAGDLEARRTEGLTAVPTGSPTAKAS